MEKATRGKRASEIQKEFLINFLEENVDVAHDNFVSADGSRIRDKKWKELAMSLNALDGTQKDGQKWRKYWSDFRLHTREKYTQLKQAEQRSGINGLGRIKSLSPLEERVLKLSNLEAVDGNVKAELGFDITPLVASCDDCEQPDASIAADADNDTTIAADAATASTNEPSTPTASITRSSTASRSRKRKSQHEAPQFDKNYKIEERKLKELITANNLKREKIAILKEQVKASKLQTKAITADAKAKENLVLKLQHLIDSIIQIANTP